MNLTEIILWQIANGAWSLTAVNHESAVQQAVIIQDGLNKTQLVNYLGALNDWVTNEPRIIALGGIPSAEPKAPGFIRLIVSPSDNVISTEVGPDLVSNITAKDVRPIRPNEIGAVGFPVGGEIPTSDGFEEKRWYCLSTSLQPGYSFHAPDGGIYTLRAFGFGNRFFVRSW